MTKEELQHIIERFNEDDLKKEGIFGISQYGGGPDESFIRANKEGLELFALELLKASRDSEAILADTEKQLIPLSYEENWIDESSQTIIQYVEPIGKKQDVKSKVVDKPTLAAKLLPYGCAVVALVLLVSMVTGFISLVKWLF